MLQRDAGPHSAIRGARVSLVGEHDEWLNAIQEHLLEHGAVVERITLAALDQPNIQLGDAVLIHLARADVAHGTAEARRARSRVEALGRQRRVIGLIDDPLAEPFPGLLDFVLPPFHPAEVAARLQRVLLEPASGEVHSVGNLEVSVVNRTVVVGGRPAEVTYQEFELLRALVTANGRVLTRNDLARELGHPDADGTSRRVDIHVHRLRSKLSALSGASIETVRNVGYRLAQSSN